MFIYNEGAISWKFSKQITIVNSITEAKYITTLNAAKEVIWMKKFITELGVVPTIDSSIPLFFDNCVAMA